MSRTSRRQAASRNIRRSAKHQARSLAKAHGIKIKIFILPQDMNDFCEFITTLMVYPKIPQKESTPFFTPDEIIQIRKMAKIHQESDDIEDKPIQPSEKINFEALNKKLEIAQNLFWARSIEEDGNRLFTDEEAQKLIESIPSKKRIRNDFLMERYERIFKIASSLFLKDASYQQRIEKSEEMQKKREEATKEAKEESQDADSKILRKASRKFEQAKAIVEQEREKHAKELHNLTAAFAEERDKLLAEIETLKTERDTLNEANIELKNNEITLKKQLDSESGRADNLKTKNEELLKSNEELLEKLKDVVPREDFDKAKSNLQQALATNVELSSRIGILTQQILDFQQSPKMLFFDAIVDAVAGRTQELVSQKSTEIGIQLNTLEAIVKGQQTFISKLSAPQTEKQLRDEEDGISRLEKIKASLLEQGYTEEEFATLTSKRIAYFGDMGSDFGGFSSFWKVLNSQSEFFSVEDYEGKDIDREIEASRFDFVILSRNRSHGNHSYQMSNFDNPKLIDYAHYTVNSRFDAVERILGKL